MAKMGRPRTPPGQHGVVRRVQLGPGQWRAYTYVRTQSGARRQRQRDTPPGMHDRTGKAAEDALLAAVGAEVEATAPNAVTPATTLKALWERRASDLEAAGREPGTIETLWTRWRAVEPHAGGLTVGECTPARLDALLAAVQASSSGSGVETRRQVLSHLRHVMGYALRDGAISSDPTTALAGLPKPKRQRERAAEPIAPERIGPVLAAILGSEAAREADLIDPLMVQAMTGLRIGEVLGIAWGDIAEDADGGAVLHVRQRARRVKGEGMRLRPITDESRKGVGGGIHLPPFAVGILRARAQEPRPTTHDLVFPTPGVGSIRDVSNFQKSWRKVRETLAEPEFGTSERGLTGTAWRKTVAGLLDAELGLAAARDQLGHLSERTTAIYVGHRRRQGGAEEAAGVIQAALGGLEAPSGTPHN